MKKICFLLTFTVLFISCQRDNIDLSLSDQLSFNPDLQIPLVNAKLRVSDLVKADSTLTIDPNDQTISVVYVEDSLFEFAVIDFIQIPDQTPTIIPLNENASPVAGNFGLGVLGGAQLELAEFRTGYLVYSINTDQPVSQPVDLTLTISNAYITNPTDTFKNTFTLPANMTTVKDSVDLSGLTFDLTNGTPGTFNFLALLVGIADTSVTSNTQVFDLSINFAGLTVGRADGFFGSRTINIPSGKFDFDLGGLEEFTNGLTLTNPSLTLIATSNVGIEIELAPRFNGVNADRQIQGLGFQPQNILAATDPNIPRVSPILVNKDNSTIVDFLSNIPNQILYSGKATLNPGVTTANNFITQNAKVKIGMEVNIPLEFTAENMMLEQRLNINIPTVNNEGVVDALTLFFNNKNGFPFELNLSLSFLDSVTGDSINGVTIPLLEPAPIDMAGVVTMRTERQFSVVFTDDELEALTRVKEIILRGRLNTPNDGSRSIKLLSSYGLQTIISARTKLNVKLPNDEN